MAAEASSEPGIQVGPTSEFSLFFHVKPGHGAALRESLRALQESPGYRPGDYNLPMKLFAAVFQHVEGFEGLPDLEAVKKFISSAQVTAVAYARNYGGTVKEIRKAERVNAAFQQVLDDPEAGELLQAPALAPLLAQAAD